MTALNTNANELYSHLNSDEGHRSADYNLKRTVQTSLAPIERRRSRKIIHIVCVKKTVGSLTIHLIEKIIVYISFKISKKLTHPTVR